MKVFIWVVVFAVALSACSNAKKTKTTIESISVSDTKSNAVVDMVLLNGGKIQIGSDSREENERPVHEVDVKPFYLDITPTTVAQFRKFVEATGFVTEAEKYGDAAVYNFKTSNWELLKGATWQLPLGPTGDKAIDNHPVTQVSWNDAVAYSKWVGKRLPTEVEWEFAAKSGKNTTQKFSWGNDIQIGGKYMCNVWQGELGENQTADGFTLTSPVGYFGTTEAGLSDMGGNVWQWCSDTYSMYPGALSQNPIDINVKAIRGGSFFYDERGENSYTVTGRSFNSHETSLFNTGFRCAKDAN